MKNRIVSIFIIIIMTSCGVSKTVRASKKVIKGQWQLSSIAYNGTGVIGLTLLNDVSLSCFEGSVWSFVPNNNTGTYAIDNNSCNPGNRYFVFTIDEIDPNTGLYDFLLKPTNERYKSDTNKGFRLNLNELSENTMQWEQTVNDKGQSVVVTMNFTKI